MVRFSFFLPVPTIMNISDSLKRIYFCYHRISRCLYNLLLNIPLLSDLLQVGI